MTTTFNTSQSIGDIVAILPKASEVFKEYNIDFCCGGNRPLSEAVTKQNLNEKEILEKLEGAYLEAKRTEKRVDFRQMKSSELIDYIVSTHHTFMKKALPEISGLTEKILRVHGTNHSELFQVHKLFNNLKTELEQHLIKEEELLFPLIKEYDLKPEKVQLDRVKQVIKETEDEHEGAGDVLKQLRRITQNYMVPKDGCTTFGLTYIKLQEVEADLFEHIHLENNILFKRLVSEQ